MTSSHGRKSRARNKSRSRSAAYAAANAGTLHRHDSGPSGKDLQPADPTRWGVASTPDMRTAAALIGACIERCAPCRESLTAKLLDGEAPVALAMAAGAVYNLRVIHEPDAEDPAARPRRIFYLLVQHARLHAGDARLLTETVERMPRADRGVLLEAALERWTYYGPEGLGLMRGPGGLSDLTAISDPATARPGAEADVHHASGDRPKAETDPADQAAVRRERDSAGPCATSPVSPAQLPVHRPSVSRHPSKEIRIHMSENTEDIAQNAENAARSLAELVCDLQHQGIAHPLQAHHLYSLLGRCAGEMKTTLILLRTFVEELRDQGLLMTDYRGELLGDVLQRYAESSAAAEQLAGVLGEAGSVGEVPAGNGSTTADHFLAVLAADLQHRGIEYPLEAYRIYSFLTRCAGEMRTALALLEASGEVLQSDDEVQRYAESSLTAVQLAGVLGKAYSAVGHLAYKETSSEREPAPQALA
ncbi:hypothetical protein [Streptomyces rhizosphaerihabitans]|uniref:hypothetical protein n=1 Tax=Streptomyces rhizosphaerihabitans TaxID=1266770 RepID=UPI0021BE2D2B|nr:hypothetical protein [Streptomyces rhizosphaerihabitans]MCT9010563.1 hypothetical protein [Streptomyces rhizosphaerihabitans]